MKGIVTLLLCSLVANAVLFIRSRSASDPLATAQSLERKTVDQSKAAPSIAAFFSSATVDGASLKARLEAAGFPPDTVRAAVMAHLQHANRQREQAILGQHALIPFWQTGAGIFGFSGDAGTEKELNRLRRELRTQTRELFGSAGEMGGDAMAIYEQRWGPLPKEKIETIQRITNDYGELNRELLAGRSVTTLTAEDREKLALLAREQRIDLEAVLTPDELFEYDVRTSSTASRLRSQLQAFSPTEEEFRTIFRAQYALDQASGRDANPYGPAYVSLSQRDGERAALLQNLQGALSDQRLADYDFATNPSNTNLVRITNRLGLPMDAAREISDVRTQTMQAVAAIRSNPSLTSAERNARIAEVARATTEKISGTLGDEGFETYLGSAGGWLVGLTTIGNRPSPRAP